MRRFQALLRPRSAWLRRLSQEHVLGRLIGLAGPQRSITSHSRLFAERNVALKVAYARRFWLTGVIR
jgi:hypothetical protein